MDTKEYTIEELKVITAKVNDIFYDKVYEDEWLKQIFGPTDIDHIKSQQTDFILQSIGGPRMYMGRPPQGAHPHIFIQQDMWDLREKYLKEALEESGAPESFAKKWLSIDNAFKSKIIKKSLEECHGRWRTEDVINIPNPKAKPSNFSQN